jgi:putative transposase
VWALDFQFDQTADGKVLKLLNIVDEHTREELGSLVVRRIDADATVAGLEHIVTKRGAPPRFIRCDNGPELTANALRDWCRFSGAGTSYIEPGAPWENPFVESFGSQLRFELLSTEQLDTCLKHRSWSATGSMNTTTTGRMGAWNGARRRRTLEIGNWIDSHKRWTYKWGRVTTLLY